MVPTTILLALYLEALPARQCPRITAFRIFMSDKPSELQCYAQLELCLYAHTSLSWSGVCAMDMSSGERRNKVTRIPVQGPAHGTYLKWPAPPHSSRATSPCPVHHSRRTPAVLTTALCEDWHMHLCLHGGQDYGSRANKGTQRAMVQTRPWQSPTVNEAQLTAGCITDDAL